MKHITIILSCLILTLGLLAIPTYAEEAPLAAKLELAQKMHEYRPVRDQVDKAIERLSLDYPRENRELFILAMRKALNYKAIEKASIESMVETYTLEELTAMTEYYSKPEARSAAEKMDSYLAAVQPTIVRLLDKAIMEIRMGEK